MRKNLLGTLASVGLLIGLILCVLAAYSGDSNKNYTLNEFTITEKSITVYSDYEFFSLSYESPSLSTMAKVDFSIPTISSVIVNGVVVGTTSKLCTEIYDDTYVSIATFLSFLDEAAEITEDETYLTATGEGYSLSATVGQQYLIINDRYIYIEDGVLYRDTGVLVPIDVLSYVMGAEISTDSTTGDVTITQSGAPLESGRSYYNGSDLYWLSHIINAESGNQSLDGKIAVGNVVENRVASSSFPDTIEAVLFSGNQFTPVSNGSIYLNPNEESIIAAKLVLDGAVTGGNSLFFHRSDVNAWAASAKDYVTTIGDHSFYA